MEGKVATTAQKVPLNGICVLDLTLAMAGPMCTQRLAEMTAGVITIEAPEWGDFARHVLMAGVIKFGNAVCFVTLNRSKRSLVLDFKSEAGQAVLADLVLDVDVLVQSCRSRAAVKQGIDFAALSAFEPRLVYGSISGCGDTGPFKDRPRQDLLLQSFTGLTFNGRTADGLPQPWLLYTVDVTASHMVGEKSADGIGGTRNDWLEVEVSMMGAITEMQSQEVTCFLAAAALPQRGQQRQVSIYQEPPYGIYKCSKSYFSVAQADLVLLATALKVPGLAIFKANRLPPSDITALTAWCDQIVAAIAVKFLTASAIEWDALLAHLDVWCMVANDYAAFLADLQAAEMLIEMDHTIGGSYKAVAPGIRFLGIAPQQMASAPANGAHACEILRGQNMTDAQIDTLVSASAVFAMEQV